MCQKAFGSYFAPLAGVKTGDFEVTRGTIATFHSSDPVVRGFCRDCGTPLTFAVVELRQDRRLARLARRAGEGRGRSSSTASSPASPGSHELVGAARRDHGSRRAGRPPQGDRRLQPPAPRPRHRGLAGAGRSAHRERLAAHRRLPVRRGALPRRAPRARLDLPLPHVPEGVRRLLRAAGHRPRRRVDARRAEAFSELEPRRAAASAATAARRSPTNMTAASSSPSAPSTIRRSRAPDDPGEPGRPATLRRRPRRYCPSAAPATSRRPENFLRGVVSHQHPDHDTAAWPPAEGR